MKKEIGIGIIGGTGFGAGELLKLLVGHPQAQVVSVVSSSSAGKEISSAHSNLQGFYNLKFESDLNTESFQPYTHKVIFLALPHGHAVKKAKEIIERFGSSVRIIDLSGDLRLKNQAYHAKYYTEVDYAAELRKQFVYGLPELNKEAIRSARYISNPGCYATASILALAPIVNEIAGDIFIDGKSGTSGAGRSLSETFHHPYRHANAQAYKMLDHRHEPEIAEGLGDLEHTKLSLGFVPHLIPVSRGMLVSCFGRLKSEKTSAELNKIYQEFYKDSAFIRISSASSEIRNVVGSNFCDISVTARGKQFVAISAIDNLVKGMAGQAIQNMNLMLGIAENCGLNFPAVGLN